jgi:hypothetical protein
MLFARKRLTKFSGYARICHKETANAVVEYEVGFGALVVDWDGVWLFLEGGKVRVV